MDDAKLLLAEAEWRGAVLPEADRKVLLAAMSHKGF